MLQAECTIQLMDDPELHTLTSDLDAQRRPFQPVLYLKGPNGQQKPVQDDEPNTETHLAA